MSDKIDYEYKIRKYTFKLKNTENKKKASQYQTKLQYYHEIKKAQAGGADTINNCATCNQKGGDCGCKGKTSDTNSSFIKELIDDTEVNNL